MHHLAIYAILSALLFGALVGRAESTPKPEYSVIVKVIVSGPTVVGFFPPVTQEQIVRGNGAGEGLAHLNFALSDVAKCLQAKNPSVSLELAHVLVLELGGSEREYELPSDWAHAVGAYLAAPGREPRVVYAMAGPSSLQFLLPNAAAEYFEEPGCKVEL